MWGRLSGCTRPCVKNCGLEEEQSLHLGVLAAPPLGRLTARRTPPRPPTLLHPPATPQPVRQGEDEVGRPLLERALDIQERALGPDHPDVVAIRDVLNSE